MIAILMSVMVIVCVIALMYYANATCPDWKKHEWRIVNNANAHNKYWNYKRCRRCGEYRKTKFKPQAL